jgi:hypothetical protein
MAASQRTENTSQLASASVNTLARWRSEDGMLHPLLVLVFTLTMMGSAMAEERIRISSSWGEATAEMADNAATKALLHLLPVSIDMRDHLRQEKTGNLPSDLEESGRQLDFSAGTLGLWSSNHFVVYYREGRVPQPGIIILGRVTGDVSIFDRPGPVTVRIERLQK